MSVLTDLIHCLLFLFRACLFILFSTGLSSCLSCSAGSYSSLYGSINCIECLAGSFTSQLNSISCSSCPIAQFTSINGSIQCQDCPQGKYQDSTGQRNCKKKRKKFQQNNQVNNRLLYIIRDF